MSTPADQLGAPTLNPSAYPAWQDAQRKQQIAQMLMGAFQNSANSPNPLAAAVGPYQVQARRSLMQNVAPLVTALMAGKAQNSSLAAQQNAFHARYNNPQSAADQAPSTGPGAGIISPDASQGAQDAAAAVTAGTGLVKPPVAAPAAPRNLANPTGLPPGTAQWLRDTQPQVYQKIMEAQMVGTPEWQNAVRMNNGDVNAAMAQMRAEANVKGTMHMRQGEDIVLPNGQTVRNPVLGPGETLTRDAQGNPASVSLIPGAADAAGTLKGVQTAADVANTPRMVPMGGGSERLMYPGDPNGPGLPPALRQQGMPSAPQPTANAPGPNAGGVAASRPNAPPTPAAIPQKDSSGILSNNLWSNIPKMQIPTTPGQTTDAYQQKIIDTAAQKHQDLVNKFGEQSAAGTQQLEYLTEAEKALPNAETGPMTDYLTHNRGLLIEAFPSLAGALGGDKVAPTLELNKQLTNAALQGARTTFGSRMTQNEVKLQTDEMSPSAGMTRDALVSLISQAKMKAAYGIQQDKDYSDYHAQNGDPNRFESQYNVMRPITRFSAQYDTPAPALDRLKANPSLLPDFTKKYGWDPTR
jgi:hypothetical protein